MDGADFPNPRASENGTVPFAVLENSSPADAPANNPLYRVP